VLKSVRKMLPHYEIPDHLALDSEYQGRILQGALRADDREFLARLYKALKSDCLGWTIQRVGDLELV
jgi:hypothetical protein